MISFMFAAFKFPHFKQSSYHSLMEKDILKQFIPVSPSPPTTELDPFFPYIDFIPT